MKLIKKDNKKGFTLIKLVVVIAILAVLALILIPSITGYVAKANDSKNEANTRSIYTTAVLAATEDTVVAQPNAATLKTAMEKIDPSIKNQPYAVSIGTDGVIKITYTANGKVYEKVGSGDVSSKKDTETPATGA